MKYGVTRRGVEITMNMTTVLTGKSESPFIKTRSCGILLGTQTKTKQGNAGKLEWPKDERCIKLPKTLIMKTFQKLHCVLRNISAPFFHSAS